MMQLLYVVLHLNLSLFDSEDSFGVEKIRASEIRSSELFPETTQRSEFWLGHLRLVPMRSRQPWTCLWPKKSRKGTGE